MFTGVVYCISCRVKRYIRKYGLNGSVFAVKSIPEEGMTKVSKTQTHDAENK
jgi:hypothetical protein